MTREEFCKELKESQERGILSVCSTAQKYINSLEDENERLKAELKKWEDRSKVVKDGYDGEVYEWENNYYIVTPYLNVFVKGLLKENAKLKCLSLHAMSEYLWLRCLNQEKGKRKWELYFWSDRCHKAYRKAKKALMEGK